MRRLALLSTVLLVLGGALPAAHAGPIYEIDYASYDVRLTDSQGVTTEATEFGFFTGPNILRARRGDAIVEIPFRKIRVLEIGEYIPSHGYSPCTVISRAGSRYPLRIDRTEGQRYIGGQTEVGSLRIQLGQVQRLELLRLSRTED